MDFKEKLRRFITKNKILIIIVVIALICSISIAIGVYSQVTHKKLIKGSVSEEEYQELKDNFNTIFNNELTNDFKMAYEIKQEKTGSYKVDVHIPKFNKGTKETKAINKEIENIFVAKLKQIANGTKLYTIYNIDFSLQNSGNIVSLIIKSTLKEGTNPQRTIIQTYTYDTENDKLLTLDDLLAIKELDKEYAQEKIDTEMKKIIKEKEAITIEGYNIYKRKKDDEIYKLENTSTYFLDNKNNLFVIYAYGNNNPTSEMDIIIF